METTTPEVVGQLSDESSDRSPEPEIIVDLCDDLPEEEFIQRRFLDVGVLPGAESTITILE